MMKVISNLAVLLYASCVCGASVVITDQAIALDSQKTVMALSRDNGSILSFGREDKGGSMVRSSTRGLWSVELADRRVDATDFSAKNDEKKFSYEKKGAAAVDLIYTSKAITLVTHVRAIAGGFEFSATATPMVEVLKSVDLPAKLVFDPQIVERLIAPCSPNDSVGLALNRKFFTEQPLDDPTVWRFKSVGSKAFVALFGQGAMTLGEETPATRLKVTRAGTEWFSSDVARRVNAAKVPVSRSTPEEFCDLTLVASESGAYFAGSRLAGNGGRIWRVGAGARGERQERVSEEVVLATVRKLMAGASEKRCVIALLDLSYGPSAGFWSGTKVKTWRGLLRRAVAAEGESFQFESITSISELNRALSAQRHLCIINPYGEGFPAKNEAGLLEAMATLKKYIHAGGNWFETGGYSFYQLLHPRRYIEHTAVYPPAYADFLHLQSSLGDFAVYRAQPRERDEPWEAARRHEKIFIPAKLFCGGDESGGYMGRSFTTWVKARQSWSTPSVHLTAGFPLDKTLADYRAKNSITAPLEKKIAAGTLAKLKQAPLLYLSGSCQEKMNALDWLPVPSLIHFADYLRGGFDKQYPDHLPPNKEFGTPREFQSFVAALHAKGHLFSPYTNPTWWCDEPKGPTFEREGTAPLLVMADGKNCYEKYGNNPGWTTTLWHPAVQAVNRKVRTQFIEDFPVDMLFQDQCGARGFMYDFNPAAPTPYAYCEGMISMTDADSRGVPLGTEHGWDRVANFQTMLCGMSWGIVPTQNAPSWSRSFKTVIPPRSWSIYPLAQALSHDKCVFAHHDLGQFVTDNRSLAWSLALGYHLSWRVSAKLAERAPGREWYAWLCRIQRSVGARYTGQPLTTFEHDRSSMLERDIDHREYSDDGVIKVCFGDVNISANLGAVERVVSGRRLARYGFFAESPGMKAGILAALGEQAESAFVIERDSKRGDLWVYAAPGDKIAVPYPAAGSVQLTFDGGSPMTARVLDGQVQISVPADAETGTRIQPSVEETPRAPCDRPGERPMIGVINLGKDARPVWAIVTADDWGAAIRRSPLGVSHKLTVTNITTYAELRNALREGSSRWLSIVNPYGERILSQKRGGWKETLNEVRRYVNHGGHWWECGGHSFHSEIFNEGGSWQSATIGSAGTEYLGVRVVGESLDLPLERISLTAEGEHWLGGSFMEKLNRQYAQINRSLAFNSFIPSTPLIQGHESCYVGGYRLDGWGHLWRIGGMKPNPDFATSIMIAATLRHYTNLPEPVKISAAPRLWHAVIE